MPAKVAKKAELKLNGIVNSDIPYVGNGWIKGAVVSKTHILLVVHANPFVGAKVHVIDSNGDKIVRTITTVTPIIEKVLKPDPYYYGGDIVLAEVDEAWPDTVEIYEIATPVPDGTIAYSVHQDYKFSKRKVYYDKVRNWCVADGRKVVFFKPGDSGMPWFVPQKGKFKLITLLSRGMWGEGCNLTDATRKVIAGIINKGS